MRNFNADLDRLREEIVRSGILETQKKDLRNILGKKRSGAVVDASISRELCRRGIVHFPAAIPASQDAIVFLAMRGSRSEKGPATLCRECLRGVRRVVASGPGGEINSFRAPVAMGTSITDCHPENMDACGEYGQTSLVYGDTDRESRSLESTPPSYSEGAARSCLACSVGGWHEGQYRQAEP